MGIFQFAVHYYNKNPVVVLYILILAALAGALKVVPRVWHWLIFLLVGLICSDLVYKSQHWSEIIAYGVGAALFLSLGVYLARRSLRRFNRDMDSDKSSGSTHSSGLPFRSKKNRRPDA